MRLAFDGYVLDAARHELRRGMELIAVEPQVFDLLLYLAQNPDRVIGRDELLRAVWNGRIVSDSAITNRITAARRAIGDSGEAQRLIRTVPRRGIRFLGRIEQQHVERAATSPRPRSIWTIAVSAAIGAAIALVVTWPQLSHLPMSRAEPSASPGVLVSTLPLKSPGTDADHARPTLLALSGALLGLDAGMRSPARAAAATTNPPREVAAAPPPAIPVLRTAPSISVVAPQTQKAPLPDVTVITPAPTQQANPTNPSSGATGVDEASWRVIPCATARIDLGAGAKCQAGLPVGGGLCDIARQVTTIANARYQVEADVRIFDPTKVTAAGYPGRNCTIWSGFRHLPDDFKDMNQMTRRGAGWSDFVKGDAQSTASFVESGRNCVAVERLGPPWRGGYVWVVHASICPAAGGAVHNADIDAVFTTLQLRTYDAQGNLRASLQ